MLNKRIFTNSFLYFDNTSYILIMRSQQPVIAFKAAYF